MNAQEMESNIVNEETSRTVRFWHTTLGSRLIHLQRLGEERLLIPAGRSRSCKVGERTDVRHMPLAGNPWNDVVLPTGVVEAAGNAPVAPPI